MDIGICVCIGDVMSSDVLCRLRSDRLVRVYECVVEKRGAGCAIGCCAARTIDVVMGTKTKRLFEGAKRWSSLETI